MCKNTEINCLNVCNSMESRVCELMAQGHLEASARLIARQEDIIAQLEHSNKAMAKVALQAVMDAICLLRVHSMWSVPRAAHLWSVAQELNEIADCPDKFSQGGAGDVGPEGNTARASAAAPVHNWCWDNNSSDSQRQRRDPPSSTHVGQLGREAWDAVTCPTLRAAVFELYTLLGCIRGIHARTLALSGASPIVTDLC